MGAGASVACATELSINTCWLSELGSSPGACHSLVRMSTPVLLFPQAAWQQCLSCHSRRRCGSGSGSGSGSGPAAAQGAPLPALLFSPAAASLSAGCRHSCHSGRQRYGPHSAPAHFAAVAANTYRRPLQPQAAGAWTFQRHQRPAAAASCRLNLLVRRLHAAALHWQHMWCARWRSLIPGR